MRGIKQVLNIRFEKRYSNSWHDLKLQRLFKEEQRSFRSIHSTIFYIFVILLGSQIRDNLQTISRLSSDHHGNISTLSWKKILATRRKMSLPWTKTGMLHYTRSCGQISQYRTRSAPNSRLFPFRRHLSVTEKRY